MNAPVVTPFFDPASNTFSYVAACPATKACAVIDSVLDYDPASARTSTASADAILAFIADEDLSAALILETHVHADHLSAAPYLKSKLGGAIGVGAQITDVQAVFGDMFNAGPGFAADGRQFDRLFADGDEFAIGSLSARVIHTPGHTPACVTYVIGEAAFVGDTLFMPDVGTARADFPGGDARALFGSIEKIFALPDETRVFICHDYLPQGRDAYACETSVGQQKAANIHVGGARSVDDFVALRTARDKTLGTPALMLPSVQVNMRAGLLPDPEPNGRRYLKIPLDSL